MEILLMDLFHLWKTQLSALDRCTHGCNLMTACIHAID